MFVTVEYLRRLFKRLSAALVLVCATIVFTACGSGSSVVSGNGPENKSGKETLAIAENKSAYKLGPSLTQLNARRGVDFIEAAEDQDLLLTRQGALVQLGYVGPESDLRGQLRALGISVRDSYPRYRRIDVFIESFDDLDALQNLETVQRIEALRKPVTR